MAEKPKDAEPAPDATPAAKRTAKVKRVWLAVEPNTVFDMEGHNLGVLRPEGRFFTPDEADNVRTLAHLAGVRLYEDPDKEA